jgi:hypothetical protein
VQQRYRRRRRTISDVTRRGVSPEMLLSPTPQSFSIFQILKTKNLWGLSTGRFVGSSDGLPRLKKSSTRTTTSILESRGLFWVRHEHWRELRAKRQNSKLLQPAQSQRDTTGVHGEDENDFFGGTIDDCEEGERRHSRGSASRHACQARAGKFFLLIFASFRVFRGPILSRRPFPNRPRSRPRYRFLVLDTAERAGLLIDRFRRARRCSSECAKIDNEIDNEDDYD